jgi:predicted metal-dependent peptidase
MKSKSNQAQVRVNMKPDDEGEEPKIDSHFEMDAIEEQAELWEDNPVFNEETKRIIDHAKLSGSWGTITSNIHESIIAAYSGKIPFINKLRGWIQKAKLKGSKKIKTSSKFKRNQSECSHDILSQGYRKSGGLKILLAVDTSGSVGTIDLQRGYGIINKFISANGFELTVMQFDCTIKSIEEVKHKKITFDISGRGGTCVEEVIQYANKHKDVYSGLMVFTDGDFNKDLPKCLLPDLLWVHVTKGDHERNKATYNQGDVAFF